MSVILSISTPGFSHKVIESCFFRDSHLLLWLCVPGTSVGGRKRRGPDSHFLSGREEYPVPHAMKKGRNNSDGFCVIAHALSNLLSWLPRYRPLYLPFPTLTLGTHERGNTQLGWFILQPRVEPACSCPPRGACFWTHPPSV